MSYQVRVGKRVQKTVARLPRQVQKRVLTKLKALAEDPRPAGCEPVRNAPKGTYRVWVGRYRVIYTVRDADQVIVVARVGKRDESTYRRL